MKKDLLKLSNDLAKETTRKLICAALIELLDEQEYKEITIVNICKKAQVSRQAFYNNYKDKKEVFKDIVIKINEHALNSMGRPFQNDIDVKWYINFYNIVDRYSKTILKLYKCGFQADYLNITNEIILSKDDILDEYDKLNRLAWNGAIQNIMHEWIINGQKENIEYMAEITYKLLNKRR